MGGYFLNFIVYTAAMTGVIFIAMLVYKKMFCGADVKSKFLNIEDTMAIAPRKKLYVVRAGEERFLIASDAERTTLISKLKADDKFMMREDSASMDDLPVILDFQNKRTAGKTTQQVLRNIVHNI